MDPHPSPRMKSSMKTKKESKEKKEKIIKITFGTQNYFLVRPSSYGFILPLHKSIFFNRKQWRIEFLKIYFKTLKY